MANRFRNGGKIQRKIARKFEQEELAKKNNEKD